MECGKCKKPVSVNKTYCHRCYDCDYRLCRACDDATTLLNWYEPSQKEADVYLCEGCIKKREERKAKPKTENRKPI